jgi:hypothetical protein
MTEIKSATTVISDAGYPLPIELRPIWRIGLICLSIQLAGAKAGTLKLNKARLFLWMLIRPKNWDSYYCSLHSYDSSTFSMSSDKSTETAIELAIAKGFVKLESDSLVLDSEGLKLLQLTRDLNIFQSEIDFLQSIKSKVTEKYIKRVLGS